eukprot:15022544-Alexandrium_andersonii.AAC.1
MQLGARAVPVQVVVDGAADQHTRQQHEDAADQDHAAPERGPPPGAATRCAHVHLLLEGRALEVAVVHFDGLGDAGVDLAEVHAIALDLAAVDALRLDGGQVFEHVLLTVLL